ncbi:MAG: hypothetical protein GXP48_07100 [Acidobacteria bacterium]|nr:hypothetical protein [Acidobacteriota bacterium]
MTWAFTYLVIFLLGFTLAIVTGLVKRLLHPSDLCDSVIVPAHEHWARLHTPKTDLLVSFLTFFGLVALVLQGLTLMTHQMEILIGLAAGLIGAIIFRGWLCKTCEPAKHLEASSGTARVVKTIPVNGFGQIELQVGDFYVKLAARSRESEPIPDGTVVTILERDESILIVSPCDHENGDSSPKDS